MDFPPHDTRLGDGYAPAVTNFGYLAGAALTTREAVGAMRDAAPTAVWRTLWA